nr:GSCFA domain-containing protein [uncultured Brevundimonas sp.]
MTISLSVFGNCQSAGIADCLGAMLPDARISSGVGRDLRQGAADMESLIREADVIVSQTVMTKAVREAMSALDIDRPIIELPSIYFTGFHPDTVYATCAGESIVSVLGKLNSSICLFAWKSKLTADETISLFNARTYEALGFFDHYERAKRGLIAESQRLGLDIAADVRRWERGGAYLYSVNHPKLPVLSTFARLVVEKLGLTPATERPELLLPDALASNIVWPVYPEIGAPLGVEGEYVFKPKSGGRVAPAPLRTFGLEEFVRRSFKTYKGLDPHAIECARFDDGLYASVIDRKKIRSAPAPTRHPYRGLPDHQFWRKAVSDVEADLVDPVVGGRARITGEEKIATAGSCFAQHIARALSGSGYNYFVPEAGDGLDPAVAAHRNYGVFSCRYGNIYTPAQLAQLFRRAEGDFTPVDSVWQRPNGRFVDAFRPEIEPDGFADEADLIASREEHLAAVRRMVRETDVFVFTLGLTEAWRSRIDGAVYPLAPGVAGGEMDPERYEFCNFDVSETDAALEQALQHLWSLNPRARVILTVSPVPLAATYEAQHVLVSTTYSKAVLRVVADAAARRHAVVDYFPSFEIITGAFNRGAYYADDLREVTSTGVGHVMRLFMKHNTAPLLAAVPANAVADREMQEGQKIICEEALLAEV